MKTSDFYYDLPQELIAQTPLADRTQSRMLVLDRNDGALTHTHFYDVAEFLHPGDCLILNDSRVMPARLNGINTESEKPVELLLLTQRTFDTWEVLAGPGKRARIGAHIRFCGNLLVADVLDVLENGNRLVRFQWEGDNFWAVADRLGEMPLPPYIREKLENGERYQTVYARELGSAAAPTAGLHFTDTTLNTMSAKGIGIGFLTLHVGIGTFRPVKVENFSDHKMHAEAFTLSAETAALINNTKASGGKVYAVGTTCCRTLEHIARKYGKVTAASEWTDIFIYPGFQFKVLDGLLTNFHLPESTLIMLVSAFAGYENTMNAYAAAVQERYRFFSFGDCMLIV